MPAPYLEIDCRVQYSLCISSFVKVSSLANEYGGRNVSPLGPVKTVPNCVESFCHCDISRRKYWSGFSGSSVIIEDESSVV